MRKWLIPIVVLAILAVMAVIVVRQVLVRDVIRTAVEGRLSAMLGQPVGIGRLDFTLFPRLSVTGSDVRFGGAGAVAPALEIGSVRLVPRLSTLFSTPIVIDRVDLDGFTVSALRDGGNWQVPSVVPASQASGPAAVDVERVRLNDARIRVFDRAPDGRISETASIDDIDADVTVLERALRLSAITGRIGDSEITGEARSDAGGVTLKLGAASIADEDLPRFLRLLGGDRPALMRLPQPASVSVELRTGGGRSPLTGSGVLRAPEVRLDPLRLDRLEAAFAIEGSRLQFRPMSFGLYGGTHQGTATMTLSTAPPGWASDSRVEGLDVGDFLQALTTVDQRIDGKGALDGSLRGRVGEPLDRSLLGRARITVTDGVVRQFPLLSSINRALRLADQEGSDTRFERLTATLTFVPGGATTDDLLLEADHLRVRAEGRIGADRSLDMRGVAIVSADRAGAAVASIRELARLRSPGGEIAVPLTISGSLDAPSFGVDVAGGLRQGITDELRRRLGRIIK